MPLLTSIISWWVTKRMSQIDLFKKYPMDVQHEMFFKLIKACEQTEIGRTFDFKSINTIREFKQRIPLHNYESLEPQIDRIRRGEKNILWNTEIKWFAKSSGTTNDKSKYIPVSREALEECHFRGGKDVLALYVTNFPESNLFWGKSLVIGGSQQINQYDNEMYYGDLSAVLIQNLPFWVNFIRTPDISIALHDEWEQKIELMANATIKDNVTSISGVPSWTLVLLKRILEITGKNNILDVWPELEAFVHGGVSFTPYREQFKKIIPSAKMNYMETYNASEGFFGIQNNPGYDDMLLMLDYGIYYEFLPLEFLSDFQNAGFNTLTLDEVEIDKNYAMIISTNGGLWRYLIGDTVKFTSKYPFKIKITGRTKHFINAFGEELIIDNAEVALKAACEKTNAIVREYTAAPVYMGTENKGTHQWFVEFEREPDDIEHFMEVLDNTLKSVNSDYEAKRYKNLSLVFPKIVVAKQGIFYRWLKERGKLGGQHKIPRLSNDREIIDVLLEMNK